MKYRYKIQLQILEKDKCNNQYHIIACVEKEITKEEFERLHKELIK